MKKTMNVRNELDHIKEINELFESVPDSKINYSDWSNVEFKFSKPIDVHCFTDVHIGHRSFDKPKFLKAIIEVQNNPNAYCFFNGDQLDFTPSGHHNARNEQSMTNEEQVKFFNRLLEKLGNKVLWIRHGNHELRQVDKAANPLFDEYCRILKVPVLKTGMDRCHIYIGKKKWSICSSHGIGLNSQKCLERMQLVDKESTTFFVDTNYYGKFYDKTNNKDVNEPIFVICGGSFEKYDGHAIDKNMRPTNTGYYILTLTETERLLRKVL